MHKDIALIRPRYDLASSLYNKPGKGSKECYPSLGLYYLAAKLQEGGYSVEIVDGLFLDRQALLEKIKQISPKLIGIYVISSVLSETASLIRDLRSISEVSVVLGGPHVTHCPESIKNFFASYGIRGDAEESLLRLADFLIYGKGRIEEIPGIVFWQNNSLIFSEKAVISDLNILPFPNFSPAAESNYFFPLNSDKMTTMITSRGCPFDCVYCGLPNKKSYQTREVDGILSEIEVNLNKGYRYIDFKDDIFTYDMERIKNLCKKIIFKGIEFKWGCETRIDFLDEELIRLMKMAGCQNIKFGIESGSRNVQRAIGKVVPVDKIKNIFKLVKRRKIDVIAYFSLGHPEEKLEDMKKTVELITQLGPDYMDVTLCVPIPGSRLFDIAVKEGKLPSDFWQKVNEIEIMPVYAPDGVTLEEMRNLQKEAYRKFYFNFYYIFCQLQKIKTLGDLYNKIKLAWLLWREACS